MFYVDHLWKDALHVLTIDALEICMAAFHKEIKICMHFVKNINGSVPFCITRVLFLSVFISEGYSV